MEVGEHVVGLVPQLGHCPPWPRDVDAWIGGLDALVADLFQRETSSMLDGGSASPRLISKDQSDFAAISPFEANLAISIKTL